MPLFCAIVSVARSLQKGSAVGVKRAERLRLRFAVRIRDAKRMSFGDALYDERHTTILLDTFRA